MDVLRALAKHGEDIASMRVEAVMNRDFVSSSPKDTLDDALEIVRTHRIRHLPIVENGMPRAVLGVRDLLQCKSDQSEMNADEMRHYFFGTGYR